MAPVGSDCAGVGLGGPSEHGVPVAVSSRKVFNVAASCHPSQVLNRVLGTPVPRGDCGGPGSASPSAPSSSWAAAAGPLERERGLGPWQEPLGGFLHATSSSFGAPNQLLPFPQGPQLFPCLPHKAQAWLDAAAPLGEIRFRSAQGRGWGHVTRRQLRCSANIDGWAEPPGAGSSPTELV